METTRAEPWTKKVDDMESNGRTRPSSPGRQTARPPDRQTARPPGCQACQARQARQARAPACTRRHKARNTESRLRCIPRTIFAMSCTTYHAPRTTHHVPRSAALPSGLILRHCHQRRASSAGSRPGSWPWLDQKSLQAAALFARRPPRPAVAGARHQAPGTGTWGRPPSDPPGRESI
ncbi:uncharacterized protein UV8b_06923 [Ustilaginoidea virens]|uniref:Uncharacterized protein n=1 Tax=Ustilaginoidea virens TaxID=1159556 RepID=A0A8E5MK21_USTVR|nr:uncharacterized protein UV8b_06923 [Ustilaginoidea virens]QUC22682.1 hypothetical protein UV8b_06923 [Ustilaginoidea virens]